jgi:hypothetical protein
VAPRGHGPGIAARSSRGPGVAAHSGPGPGVAAYSGGWRHGGRHHRFRHFRGPAIGLSVPYVYGYYEEPYELYAATPEEECYVVRRVLTEWGYRYRRVYVCD